MMSLRTTVKKPTMSLRCIGTPSQDIKIPVTYYSNCETNQYISSSSYIEDVDIEPYEEASDEDSGTYHSGNYWRRAENIAYQFQMEEMTKQEYCRGHDFYGACFLPNKEIGSIFSYRVTEANHYGQSPFHIKIGYIEEKAYYPYRGIETVSVIIQKVDEDKIHIQADSKYLEQSVLAYRYTSKDKKKKTHKKSKNNDNIPITTLYDANKTYNPIHDLIDGKYCTPLIEHRRRFLIYKVICVYVFVQY